MDRHGGKMYYASSQLLKPDKTGYMPNFEAQDLFGKKINTTEKLVNKISLMTFVYAKYGEVKAKKFSCQFALVKLTINCRLMQTHLLNHSWKSTKTIKKYNL